MRLQAFLDHPAVKGIAMGCIDGEEFASGTLKGVAIDFVAHAHIDGKQQGWICFKKARYAVRKDGSVTRTAMHELAHLISESGHDDKWRQVMHELGQPIPALYQKKPRH